jgi:hypothetical protein
MDASNLGHPMPKCQVPLVTVRPKRNRTVGLAASLAELRKLRRVARKHGYKGAAILRDRSLNDVLAEAE